MAELIAIWLKQARRGPMVARRRVLAVAGQGLEGNLEQGGKRQVTLLDAAAWGRAEAQLGHAVESAARRANLLLSGLELAGSRGRVLRLGACRIRVGGETRPCRRMEHAAPGLEAALAPEWRGGIYGEVLTGGEIALGDPVRWETAGAPATGTAR